ncbi:hypothetical protein HUJ05_012699 [Dendroctonus ponderosae]|nr:hypothetical protein HUJ05_012699 [Dendroctonus ponderosae]
MFKGSLKGKHFRFLELVEITMDFKTQFLNLNGVHYKEVKTSFYKLLHCTDPLVLVQQLPDIQPKNHLQRIFYVDILIRAKQVKALVKILQDGNVVLVSKILKEKWFFEEAFKAMSASEIVNDFLPTLSYPIKMKLLKKLALSLSEARMDEVFDCLLQSCSAPKIQQVLRDNEITLTVEQLRRLLAKNSDLVKSYMESYKKHFGHDFDNYSFLSYVAAKRPQLYFEFGMQHIDHVKVGRQTTKSLLRLNKDEALKNEKTVLARLNNSVVARQVQEQHLHKYLPEKLNITLNTKLLRFLKKFPQKKRMSILSMLFQKTHNDDILNHLALFQESFAAVFPQDVRRTWAKLLFEKTNDFAFIIHFESREGFRLIKEKIEVTADKSTRRDLLAYLIEMCHANKDYHCYESVLRYISIRHRNEDTCIRQQLLHKIGRTIDDDLTTDGFWDAVKELVQLARANGDSPPSQLLSRHLIYLYNRKLPIEKDLALFISDAKTVWRHFDRPVIKKHILEKSVELVAGGNLRDQQAELLKTLFKEVVDFNAKHPDQLIQLNECATVVKCIRELIGDNDNETFRLWMRYNNNCHWNSESILEIGTNDQMLTTIQSQCSTEWNDDVLREAITQPRNSAVQENLLDFFFKRPVYNYSMYESMSERPRAIRHFLEKEPRVIAKYFHQIIEDGRGCREFDDYSLFKLYNHLGLDSELVEAFSPLVSASIKLDYKSTVIKALSQVMSTNDFLPLIAEYVPTKAKLDICDENQNQLYSTQRDVAKYLKNLEDVVPLVPLLEHFCQGDYFQVSRPLLYKVLYRVSEKQATDIIKLLMRKAVSVRKHAAYFGFALANHSTAMQVLQGFSKDELVRKYVTKGLFQYCIKNPTLPTLNMLLACLEHINMKDTELIDILIRSSSKLPKQFQPALMMKFWTTIEQDAVNAKRFGPNWSLQIGRFSDDMFLKFPEPFCGQVIGKYFLSEISFDGINTFVCMYLSVYQKPAHFIEVFSKISTHKELHWNSNNYNEQGNIFSFFARAYKMFPNRSITFLNLFRDHWKRLFSYEECFAENLGLDLMLIYMECPRIEEFANKLHGILHGMINLYGTYINHLLLDGLTFLFQESRVFGLCQVALQLLQIEPTELNCFLAVNIAEKASLPTEEKEQKALLSCLEKVDYFYVKVRYNTLQNRLSKQQ